MTISTLDKYLERMEKYAIYEPMKGRTKRMGCMIFRSQLLSAAAFEKAVVLGDSQYFQLEIDMDLFLRHY